jgi:hypothetical protein
MVVDMYLHRRLQIILTVYLVEVDSNYHTYPGKGVEQGSQVRTSLPSANFCDGPLLFQQPC